MNVRHVVDATERRRSQTRAVLSAVRREPSLLVPLLVAMRRYAPRGWWRRAPFLPVPDERYWRFRMETAYGDEEAVADADDVAAVLRWSRRGARDHK